MTLPEIAAEARRMAASYRDNVIETMPETWSFARVADDFDRLAEMAEPKPMTGMQMGVPMAGVPMKGLES